MAWVYDVDCVSNFHQRCVRALNIILHRLCYGSKTGSELLINLVL